VTIAAPVVIRPIRGRELVAVHRISSTAFEIPYSYETLTNYRHRARGGLLVAEVAGEIVGFVVATSPLISLWGGKVGEIAVLAVESGYRGQGIGSRLLQAGLDTLKARGMSSARLHVETGNAGAIALYERFGFARETRVTAYYRNGKDAYRMVKPLE